MRLLQGLWMTKLLKRLCRSLLKKWLGDLILGDLDIDQLDIQLIDGEFHLSDIALNVDLINSKLSGSAIMVKEGSIESLVVKFPWHKDFKFPIQEKCKCCEIRVEKLELVLVPSVVSEFPHVDTECSVSGSNSGTHTLEKTTIDESDSNRRTKLVSLDVDEGVKKIAYAVKWFLTSFNIKLDKVFVVFDPQTILDKKASEFNRLLAFRIEEIVFETDIPEVGPPKLHNIVRFNKAVIEFLKMDDVDALFQKDLDRGAAYGSSIHSTTAVLTGPVGGLSGELKLIIPWSDGGLNLEKIDADVTVHSIIQLRLQMSSIQWFMDVWDYAQRKAVDDQSCVYSTANISLDTSRSILSSSAASSLKSGSDSVISGREDSPQKTSSQSRQDEIVDSFTMAHVIPNWIPELVHNDQGDPDSDCDESIDQFFECFEELRNSQTNFGNSGIWDWSCSIFNAITFASTLASGSDQVPKEPPIEKNLKASIPEISVILLFSDEMDTGNPGVPLSPFTDMRNSEMFSSCLSSVDFEQSMISPATASSINMHHLEAKCQKIGLNLKTYPKTLSFKASIGHVRLDECYRTENHDPDHPDFGTIFLNNNFRREVQAALPQFPLAAQDYWVETSGQSNELTKVELLKTFGECTFYYDVSSTDQDGKSVSSTSLSIGLAPSIFWVHFHTIYMVLNFISKIESDVLHGEHKFHRSYDEKSNELTTGTNNSSNESIKKIQITLSTARIIFCFPSESSWDFGCPSTLDKFLAIDHTSSLNLGEASSPPQNERPNDFHRGTPSTSVHLATGNFDIYLIRSVNDGNLCTLSRHAFSALKIFSVTGSNCHDSIITVIWRKCAASDPDMVNKAWSLPQLHDRKIAQKENGKWAGISSCTTSEDLEESSCCICQELLQSTEFLLHVQLSCVSVHLSKKDCVLLNQMLDRILNGLSTNGAMSSKNDKEKSMPSNDIAIQSAFIFECRILDICTELDDTVEVGPLLQTELEGSWNCLKLSISKFGLFSFSNVGGVNDTSFVRVNHGEGELLGSITGSDDKTCEESKDFLLVVCKDSATMRGDGEGNNVLSFGTAGCSVTLIRNPNLQENYTSVNVRSGTIVAPGGRMDWISAVSLLFSSGSHGTEQSDDSSRINISQADEPFLSSFFLELVDVAVSYEPHFKNSALSAVAPEFKFVSCLLAASSFKLHNKSKSDSAATDFGIQLRDLGLLISGSSGSKNVTEGYGVDYLHQMGYTKIGQNTFIEAALKIGSSFWKLEISESQFDIGTCHDTTYGLIRLCSQLQQLYAPDIQDALVHLQSRWNNVQQANKQNTTSDTSDRSENSIDNLADLGECRSDGLLDDIIENAFFTDQDCTIYDIWNKNYHNSSNSSEMVDEFEPHTSADEATGVKVSCISPGSSLVTAQIPLKQNSCPEQIIDSYYMPELLNSSSLTLCNEEHQCTSCDDAGKTVNCEDGGWYNNILLTIDENHVSKRNNLQGDDVFQQEKIPSVCSLESDESCNLKGKVHINYIDVKWRMYAGDDWSLAQKDANSYPSSNGRDRSSYLEFVIPRLNIQFDMYPDGDVSVSKLSISARDVNLCDHSMHAPWKLVLGCYNSKDYPRESCSSAFRLELESVRPEPRAPLEDYRLRLEILPLQLHLDQGQLNFLINFFQNGSCNNHPHVPCENEIVDADGASYGSCTIVDEALLPFFQKFDVKPLVLHINYIPRQFDPIALGKGKYAELLNILPWKGIDLKLKHVSAKGVYGWNSICETVAAEWLEDISKNQIHKLLKGLPPIKSLVAVGSGTKKLVSLPIKSYKKDRKLLKGMQRGAVAFIRSISIEAVGLGVHLAAGAHDILLKTEHALTAVPPPLASSEAIRTKDNIRANQPENAQQGMKQAYESLTDGLGRTASALIGNPIKVYNRGAGAGPALATAICGAPAAIVAPVSASARAAHYAFLGIKNSLDPEYKKESMYKYLGPSQL